MRRNVRNRPKPRPNWSFIDQFLSETVRNLVRNRPKASERTAPQRPKVSETPIKGFGLGRAVSDARGSSGFAVA